MLATAQKPQLTDRELTLRKLLRDDFIEYSQRALFIRPKKGDLKPLKLNRAQKYLHQRIEEQRARLGWVRALILKGRQQGCCLSPNTRVLRADLTWAAIKNMRPGDEVVACDEEHNNGSRKMCTAIVEAVAYFEKPLFRIEFEDGTHIDCTDDHRWLTRKSQTQCKWRKIRDGNKKGIVPGTEVRFVVSPWEEPSFEDGWFGGLIDGEGSFSTKRESGASVRISQRPGAVLNRCENYLKINGYAYSYNSDNNPVRRSKFGGNPVDSIEVSRMGDLFRLFGKTRPTRSGRFWESKRLPDTGYKRVSRIYSLGMQRVVDLQTSKKTFIAEGLVSHNSTYVEGRFYWRVSHRKGVRAYILTHEDSATQNLYEMATRYHEQCPPILRPHTGTANAKELYFDLLDSGYKVGTAGTKAVGRSSTIQFFHGSECGFWPFAEDHAAGVLQAVPREKDTEILLESTANGIGNLFHSMWQDAETGRGDYIAVFLPWWWQDEYTASTEDFTPTPEELAYQEHSNEITPAHLAWRRIKITEIGEDLFKREYPANAAEAFQATGEESFISPASVLKARKSICTHDDAPLICGLDPAYKGSDRTVFAFRRGRRVYNSVTLKGKDNMEVAGYCANILRAGIWLPDAQLPVQIVKVFVDLGGMPGIYDRLRELGFGERVIGVNFGSTALQESAYVNRRAEMWGLMNDFISKGPCQLPDSDVLQADLCGVQHGHDSSGRLKLETKEHMRNTRGLRSPDEGDALALTFALPVARGTSIIAPIEQRQPNEDGFYF